jgi:hypothetical protein
MESCGRRVFGLGQDKRFWGRRLRPDQGLFAWAGDWREGIWAVFDGEIRPLVALGFHGEIGKDFHIFEGSG